MRTIRFALLPLALCATPVLAERVDRDQEIVIAADHASADDNARVSVWEGNVVITQGTMRITASKVTVKEDAEKNRFYVANGAPVAFRQKRDKADDYVEGWAQRAEFADKSAKLKLIDKARLKSVQGEITGDLITYDTDRELFEVGGSTQPGVPASRVKATLIPQKKDAKDSKGAPKAEAKPPAPLTLKTDPGPAAN